MTALVLDVIVTSELKVHDFCPFLEDALGRRRGAFSPWLRRVRIESQAELPWCLQCLEAFVFLTATPRGPQEVRQRGSSVRDPKRAQGLQSSGFLCPGLERGPEALGEATGPAPYKVEGVPSCWVGLVAAKGIPLPGPEQPREHPPRLLARLL